MKYTFSDYNREGLVNAEKISHLIIRKYQLRKDKLDDFFGGEEFTFHCLLPEAISKKKRQILSFLYLK